MKPFILILLLGTLTLAQQPSATPQKPRGAARVRLVETAGTTSVVDTDLFDAQKYIEESGSASAKDSADAKAKRASHEEALTHEFFAGFSQTRECDGIIYAGAGDNKPDFDLKLLVDSHDTPNQKPVWVWILNNASNNKFIAKGEEDTGALAAKSVCETVSKALHDEQAPRSASNAKTPAKP